MTNVAATAQTIRVVDGDTIEIGAEKIRLIGFDTPEKYSAKCPQEALAAAEAEDYLRDLLNERGAEIRIEREPRPDKYKRTLARLYVNNADVAELMIGMGFAVHYDCPKGRCPRRIDWCAKLNADR